MNLRRRTVLAATGVVGSGALGVGYWQRRRLFRADEIRELRDVVAIEVPQLTDASVITEPILESSYDRAVDRFDEIEPQLDPPFDRYSEEHIDEYREDLTETAPDQVTIRSTGPPSMDAARHQALSTYRRRRGRIVSALAAESPGELPESAEDRSAAVGERVESAAVPYRGSSVGDAVVASATIESTIDTADSYRQRANEYDEDDVIRWRYLEQATAAIEDAESIAEHRDGSAYDTELETLAERLMETYEDRREAAPDGFENGSSDTDGPPFVHAAVGALERSMERLGATLTRRTRFLDDGRYGLATLIHALLLPTVPLYEAFADVPYRDGEPAQDVTPEALREQKVETIDTVEPYLDADDPLVTYLAAVPLGVVRDVDRAIEQLTDDARSIDSDEWARERTSALLRYETARRYAEAIDEPIDLVDDVYTNN